MRRQSTTGRTSAKARHRKTKGPKRGNTSSAVRRTSSSVSELQNQVSALTRELAEARKQQTATSEVLRVINSTPGDLAPVFDEMTQKALELCGAAFGGFWLVEGGIAHAVATHNVPAPFDEFLSHEPTPVEQIVGRNSPIGPLSKLRICERPRLTAIRLRLRSRRSILPAFGPSSRCPYAGRVCSSAFLPSTGRRCVRSPSRKSR